MCYSSLVDAHSGGLYPAGWLWNSVTSRALDQPKQPGLKGQVVGLRDGFACKGVATRLESLAESGHQAGRPGPNNELRNQLVQDQPTKCKMKSHSHNGFPQ